MSCHVTLADEASDSGCDIRRSKVWNENYFMPEILWLAHMEIQQRSLSKMVHIQERPAVRKIGSIIGINYCRFKISKWGREDKQDMIWNNMKMNEYLHTKCLFGTTYFCQLILLFSLFLLLFMSPTALFCTIHEPYCVISANFYLYL